MNGHERFAFGAALIAIISVVGSTVLGWSDTLGFRTATAALLFMIFWEVTIASE